MYEMLARAEKQSGEAGCAAAMKGRPVVVHVQVDVRPVVEPGALQIAVVEREAERPDQMQAAVPVAAQSRAMLPVLGGISGCTRTTCSAGRASSAGNGVVAARQPEDEAARAWRGRCAGRAGSTPRAGSAPARLPCFTRQYSTSSAPTRSVRGSRRSRLRSLSSSHDAAVDVELGAGDDVRRVVDDDRRLLVGDAQHVAAVGAGAARAARTDRRCAVGDQLAVGVPAAVATEADLAVLDGVEAGSGHLITRGGSVRLALVPVRIRAVCVTGPSLTRLTAMWAPNRPAPTGTPRAPIAATTRS